MKYYYGNSYKEALSNSPVEINSNKVLQQYQENYSVIIPAEEDEHFWILVWREKGNNQEFVERYDDFDDVRADFKYLTEQTPDNFEYVVLQEVTESQVDGEKIEEIAMWGI